jgi:serpin B
MAYGCQKENTVPVNNYQPDEKILRLTNADNTFGLNLFQQINAFANNDENLFVSPVSVALALAMTYNGAAGDTKTAMEQTLSLNGLTVEEINQSYQSLIHALVTLDPVVLLTIANSIWYRNDFEVLQSFIDINQQYYNAQVNPLDFNDPASVDVINNWVDANTNHKIPSIIYQIQPENVMFLINAIYFKGTWKYTFETANTTDQPFYMEDGTMITTPVMKQKDVFGYFENELMQVLKLPYGSEKFNMIIFLPAVSHTVNDIIAELNPSNWTLWLNDFTTSDSVNVYLPKFKFSYEITLNDILKNMGMSIAFSDFADFTGINPAGNLFISNVKHKSFVEVNEEGTEAAAATVVEISFTSVPEEKYVIADRPFVFIITEKATSAVVFIGKVAQPVIE